MHLFVNQTETHIVHCIIHYIKHGDKGMNVLAWHAQIQEP